MWMLSSDEQMRWCLDEAEVVECVWGSGPLNLAESGICRHPFFFLPRARLVRRFKERPVPPHGPRGTTTKLA
jgi:hypothetical protein